MVWTLMLFNFKYLLSRLIIAIPLKFCSIMLRFLEFLLLICTLLHLKVLKQMFILFKVVILYNLFKYFSFFDFINVFFSSNVTHFRYFIIYFFVKLFNLIKFLLFFWNLNLLAIDLVLKRLLRIINLQINHWSLLEFFKLR